jgi:hypothetical protein
MHDLTGTDFVDKAAGNVIFRVQFKRRSAITGKRGGERVEDRW